MSKKLLKKTLFTVMGGIALLGWRAGEALASADFTLVNELNAPGYIYNANKSILAISKNEAENYKTNLLTTDDDSFLLASEDGTKNLFNNIANDTNAIFGYVWSERVGWISFSHGFFHDNAPANGIMDENEKLYPRFAKDANGDQDILKGYLWSDNSGWIQLSSDGFEVDNGQNETNWGVVFNGTDFSGKAWGAALGWIDFSNVTYNTTTGKFGGYACSANDCTDPMNKIDFVKVPDGIDPNNLQAGDWGVSKNMNKIYDDYAGEACELLSGTCMGGNAVLRMNTSGTGITVDFSNRLNTLVGDHDLTIALTNRFGQTMELKNTAPEAPDEDVIRFKSVVWPANCELDGEGNFVCEAPEIAFATSNNGAIADNADTIMLTANLTNADGDEVFASPGNNNVKEIFVKLIFNDSVESNQLDAAHQYDAVNYTTAGGVSSTFNESGNNADFTIWSNGLDGDFVTNLTSIAPTDSSSNKLNLTDFSIEIVMDDDFPESSFTFTKSVDYAAMPEIGFSFAPAVTTNITGFDHLIENTSSVFNVTLENESATKNISGIDLSSVFDGMILPNLAGLSAEIKAKSSSSAYTNIAQDQLQLVSNDLSGNYLIDPAGSIVPGTEIISQPLIQNSSEDFTFDLKPILILGDEIDPTGGVTFSTEVAYKIAGATKTTYHKSSVLDLLNNIFSSQVDVAGLVSSEQVYSIEGTSEIAISGGMSFEEISEAIRKNVADMTRGETAGTLPASITNWNSGNKINNGSVLYYEGNNDLIIDNGGSDFEINSSQGTIVVIGGNVYIKSNLAYSGDEASFGLIVIKDNNGNGGNVYIDPAVTKLVGGVYAEGSLMSAKDTGNNVIEDNGEIFDGFSADKSALGNQLYLNGTLISRNTIGGSRQDPAEYPKGYNQGSCLVGNDAVKCAERFDLNYVRNFVTDDSGNVINGTRTTNESNSPFFIKYDPRIQTNIPPGFEMQSSIGFEEIVQ